MKRTYLLVSGCLPKDFNAEDLYPFSVCVLGENSEIDIVFTDREHEFRDIFDFFKRHEWRRLDSDLKNRFFMKLQSSEDLIEKWLFEMDTQETDNWPFTAILDYTERSRWDLELLAERFNAFGFFVEKLE